MRSRFQQGLDELKEKLLRMGGLAEQAIDRATEAYRTRDSKFCQMVLPARPPSTKPSATSTNWRSTCWPCSSPWPSISASSSRSLKINADLERVGDQAVNIAQRVLDLISEPEVELPVDIPRMADGVSTMVQRALEAFLDGKAEVAEAVLQMDGIVDRMKDEAFVVLVQKMHDDPSVHAPGAGRTADRPQSGAHRRPCDQHRRGRDFLGSRRRCAPRRRALPGVTGRAMASF